MKDWNFKKWSLFYELFPGIKEFLSGRLLSGPYIYESVQVEKIFRDFILTITGIRTVGNQLFGILPVQSQVSER